MKEYKWRMERFNNFIRLSKNTRDNMEISDFNIDFNEFDVYKANRTFKINKEEIGKYANYLLIKKDYHHYTDEFIEWIRDNKIDEFVYLPNPITFNINDIKIIKESL